jgi:hypothetical protein
MLLRQSSGWLGDGELGGGRLQIGDRIGQLYRRDGFAQAKACAIRVGEGSCLLRIFVNNNKRWQLLTAASCDFIEGFTLTSTEIGGRRSQIIWCMASDFQQFGDLSRREPCFRGTSVRRCRRTRQEMTRKRWIKSVPKTVPIFFECTCYAGAVWRKKY